MYRVGLYIYGWDKKRKGVDISMMTASKRIEVMHERARLIRHARDKTINRILGTVSALILTGIIVLSVMLGGGLHKISDVGETGSSLLYEGVGGYVLVAVTSFMAAVVITVLCIKRNKKRKQDNE